MALYKYYACKTPKNEIQNQVDITRGRESVDSFTASKQKTHMWAWCNELITPKTVKFIEKQVLQWIR